MTNIVVIGATGNFGGRICRRIVGEKNIVLTVTSRDGASAKRLATELQGLHPRTVVRPAAFTSVLLLFYLMVSKAGAYG